MCTLKDKKWCHLLNGIYGMCKSIIVFWLSDMPNNGEKSIRHLNKIYITCTGIVEMRIKKNGKCTRFFLQIHIQWYYFFHGIKSEFKYMYCDMYKFFCKIMSSLSLFIHVNVYAINQWLLWNLQPFCWRWCIYCMCIKHSLWRFLCLLDVSMFKFQ